MDKLRAIYLELNDDNIVTALTEEETPHQYCEVSEDVSLEEIIAFLELDKYVMKFEDGTLIVIGEVESTANLVTIEEMQEQIALAISEVTEMVATILEGVMPHE